MAAGWKPVRTDWLPAVLAPTVVLCLVLAAVVWGGDMLRGLGGSWVLVFLWGPALAFVGMALLLPKGWLVPVPVVPVCAAFLWLWRATLPACESDLLAATIGAAMQGCVHLEGLGIVAIGFWTFGGALLGATFRPVLAWFNRQRRPSP